MEYDNEKDLEEIRKTNLTEEGEKTPETTTDPSFNERLDSEEMDSEDVPSYDPEKDDLTYL